MAKIMIEPKRKTKWPFAAVLIFVGMLITNSYADQFYKGFAIICCIAGIWLMLFRKIQLPSACNPLGLALLAYLLLAGASLFYGVAPSLAVNDFSRLLIAFIFFLFSALYVSNNKESVRNAIAAIAWSAVPIGILSVDAASSNLLMRPLRAISAQFGMVYDDGGLGFYNRLTTIFDNANIYAGVMSVAVLLSFYLVLHAQSKKQRIASSILLSLNTACYVLAISMGSIFFFLIACLFYLITAGKGNRLSLFLLMLEDAIIALIIAFACMLGLYGEGYTGSFIPLIALIVGSIVFAVADVFIRDRLCALLSSHKKAAISVLIAFIVVCGAFLVAALHMDAPYTLNPGESFSRSVSLPAGDYTLTVAADESVDIVINAKGQREMLTNTATKIASGKSGETISFTVPDGTAGVFVISSLPEDCGYSATISSIQYEGVERGDYMLKYTLLPSFIANRLQELTASGTAAIRTMFFRDGLKLWLQNPILGAGLATFNNGLYSVQSFFYGTKYVHNHYIQTLCDFGIVGFIIFMVVLIALVMMLWRGRKKDAALAAVLGTACVQIFGQAMTDITWSAGAPLLLFFVLFGVISAFFGENLSIPAKSAHVAKSVLQYGSIVFTAIFALLLTGNIYGNIKMNSNDLSIEDLPTMCVIDPFDRYSFQLSYLISSLQYPDSSAVQTQAEKYVAKLSTINSATTPIQLAAYLDTSGQYEKAIGQIDRSIVLNRSDSANWSSIFNLYETKLDPIWVDGTYNQSAVQILMSNDDQYLDDALSYYEQMCQISSEQWDDLELEPNNTAFLGKLMAIKQIPQEDTTARLDVFSSMVYDSDCATDVNADGISDFITGEDLTSQNGVVMASSDTQLILPAHFKAAGTYELRIEMSAPEAITAASFGEAEMPYTIEGNTIVAGFTIPEQLAGQNIDIALDLTEGAQIARITLTRTSS